MKTYWKQNLTDKEARFLAAAAQLLHLGWQPVSWELLWCGRQTRRQNNGFAALRALCQDLPSGIVKISSWGPHAKAQKIPSCVDQPLSLEKRCLPSLIFKVPGYASACPEGTVMGRWDSVHVKKWKCGCGPVCVSIDICIYRYVYTYVCFLILFP